MFPSIGSFVSWLAGFGDEDNQYAGQSCIHSVAEHDSSSLQQASERRDRSYSLLLYAS